MKLTSKASSFFGSGKSRRSSRHVASITITLEDQKLNLSRGDIAGWKSERFREVEKQITATICQVNKTIAWKLGKLPNFSMGEIEFWLGDQDWSRIHTDFSGDLKKWINMKLNDIGKGWSFKLEQPIHVDSYITIKSNGQLYSDRWRAVLIP